MSSRLVFLAHAATPGQRAMVFGDVSALEHPELVERWSGRVASWTCGPEPACRATALWLGGPATVEPRLAGIDVGRWTGRSLVEVGEAESEALSAWLSDPEFDGHGGESLAALVTRVGGYVDTRSWAPGRNLCVVTPMVAGAAAVHALGVEASVLFRLDVGPLGAVGVSGGPGSWRLNRLGPFAGSDGPDNGLD